MSKRKEVAFYDGNDEPITVTDGGSTFDGDRLYFVDIPGGLTSLELLALGRWALLKFGKNYTAQDVAEVLRREPK